ncbi:beta-galactosidase [Streptomyces sp. NBC_00264]|uniref:glycoside hydrolase family 35 protein n=1 Tax=unclassified Streptomyces TaxID=2593676 RepID=UPI00225AF077|nr:MULTISPECIES: beta-galactosidase family protein [unclassified Streptomyces]MCX4398946.1 beta-galactosidase [Streptomyces sp. NBC_01767]MCX5158166.1 beta-galactosidase [Streptomyces sp. NBC_00305]MCX5216689.1 beta-galactosidase [Streptomyces sp. NBC_00264]
MTPPRSTAELTVTERGFLRAGRPHQIVSAAIHYFRVHPELWEDRLLRLRAMGVNTVETYIAWNLHQPTPGQTDFSGQADVARFLRTAARLDLDVIVRPGPYICAEWEFGGLPAWLLADPALRLRRTDDRYLAAVDAWFDQLIPVLLPMLAGRGGPVIAVQVENEYGSYGHDTPYLDHLRQGLIRRGVDCPLFTADGATDGVLRGGMLPGTLATATFGSQPEESLATLRRHQPTGPLMCSEYWHGWFDHWGEHHHVRKADEAAGELDRMLAQGASVNLYMGHGGTNFGWWNGANHNETDYQPTCTSYDYDAPVGEAGELTEKFHAFRAVIERHRGPIPYAIPATPDRLAPQTVRPNGAVALADCLDVLSAPRRRLSPEPMEVLGQSLGLIHYRTWLRGPFLDSTLRVHGLADRAQVFLDGVPLGVLERTGALDALPITVPDTGAELDLLVENMGRINYGPLLEDRKGISGGVRIDGQYQFDWEIRPLPLTDLAGLRFGTAEQIEGPAFHRATLEVPEPADGFLALPGWTKGQVWLNGFALGRHWDRGPQRTLYAPAPVWRAGRNELVILELHRPGERIELCDAPDLGPTG